ncbi:hypothetical protein KJ969_02330 [Patescibacteria group bacterium]|nr:hypothetical protein [Patescibacteria group bacterium]
MISFSPKTRRLIILIIGVIFIANLALIPVHFAQAQLVVSDPTVGSQTTIQVIRDYLKKIFVGIAGIGLTNALDYFMQKIAYDLAVGIASGGKGQMPLFSSEGWGDYMKSTALDTVGEFVGSLSEDFGVDFCDPGTPGIKVKIQTSLFKNFLPVEDAPKPSCTWNELSSNWEDFTEDFSTGDVLKKSGVMFETGQSPLSITAGVSRELSKKVDVAKEASEKEREEGGGFLSKTGLISGKIETPGALIKKKAEGMTDQGDEAQQGTTQSMSRSISTGSFQILTSALSTFVNTLAGKLLERLFEGMFKLSDLAGGGGPSLINPEFALVGTREVAQRVYSDFITPPIKETEVYDLVLEHSTCPSQFATPNNCVIDQSFAEAVRREQTGSPLSIKEAMEQGLLHGDWPLISSYDRARNTDTFCYSYGYCYSNLVKLRKSRIIPIGWEIAAQKSGTAANQATLKEVVESFYDCGVDADGNLVTDASHPWCHLIDPNWIIKYPLTQCRAMVYGPTLLSSESDMRAEICVDAPSCIAQDDEGNCIGGWGYCTREKNTWHFDGDSCPSRYASCVTLSDRDNNSKSYLLNSVNIGACNADNTGCRWYSRERVKTGDEWTWDADTSYDSESKVLIATDKAIYFDKDVEECSVADAGCSELVRASQAGVTLNLLNNPGFEAGDAVLPDSWDQQANPPLGRQPFTYDTTGDHGFEGMAAIMPGKDGALQEVILNPSRFYTFSVYARNASPDSANSIYAGVGISKSDGAAVSLGDYYFSPANCFVQSVGGQDYYALVSDGRAGVKPPYASFVRYTCVFTTPGSDTSPYYLGKFYVYGDVWVDAVQLEESEIPTSYHEGIAQGGESVYLKKPPQYLGCQGLATDAEECGDYLKPCSPMDVGCNVYYPENGDPSVSAVATSEDMCPAVCAGYEAFREESTQWSTKDELPVFFIPDSGQECSASQVGCDEFTNLDAPEVGGEITSYFTEIRACQKPAGDSESFYTWEGSDTAGYQLKTWILKGSDKDTGPCTTLSPVSSCDDPVSGTPEYAEKNCSDIFELGINADCRQFYDTAGDVFYRYYSDTIVSTDECYRYRKTKNTGQEDCEGTGGAWTKQGECVYMGYPAESIACPLAAAGCRAYTGPGSRNIEQEFLDDFEDGTENGWEGGALSTESILLGGHSLKIAAGVGATKEWDMRKDQTYVLSFWAKGRGSVKIAADGNVFGTIELASEWNEYNVGPLLMGEVAATPSVAFTGFTQISYIDNIILKRVTDYLYLIRNSWYTPISCDMNNQGVYIPQAQLGCEAYNDGEGAAHYLKSFERLCQEDAVGCEAFIDTYNSDANGEQVFQSGQGGAEVTVPADTMVYYAYDDSKTCTADVKGCELMGRPKLAQDGKSIAMREIEDGPSVPDWQDVYFINNPERYSEILCTTEGAYCDAFSGSAGTYYFKHPQEKLCEWKEKVKVAGIEYNGWFKKGKEEPCYPGYLGGGNTYGLWKNGDPAYDGWVGLCPGEYNLCTKFIDPADSSAEYPDGREYHYLNNNTLDQSCTAVSKREGCVLFDSTTVSTKNYNSWVTYLTSQDNNYEAVPAVDCRNSDSPYCGQVCQYQVFDTSFPPGVKYYYGHNCSETSDCREKTGTRVTAACVQIGEVESNLCRSWDGVSNQYIYRKVDGTSCASDDECVRAHGDAWQCVGMSQELRGNDTNMILKVRRDRECAEWLGCQSSVSVWDKETSAYKKICTNLGLCNQYTQVGESSECINFITSEHQGDVLSQAEYASRDVSWEGRDFSGYAMPNFYSIDEIEPVNLSEITGAELPDLRFVYKEEISCSPQGSACGATNALGNKGICFKAGSPGACIHAVNGDALPAGYTGIELYNQLVTGDNAQRVIGPSCRAYPEETSPFPSGVAQWEDGRMSGTHQDYKRANICEQAVWRDLNNDGVRDADELVYEDCECEYKKLTFGNGAVTKYYSKDEANTPKGVCLNGPRNGLPCIPDIDYNDEIPSDDPYNQQTCGSMKSGGSCQALERSDTFVGWQGSCLEKDLRTTLNTDQTQTACLTWHPSYILSGGQDIYNLYQDAGYNPENTGRYWCAYAKGNQAPAMGKAEDYLLTSRWDEMPPLEGDWAEDWRDYYTRRIFADPAGILTDPPESGHYEDGGDYEELVYGGEGDERYEERWMPALPSEKLNLDEIIAIELKVVKAEHSDWPDGYNSHTNDFYKDGNNILSRETEEFLADGWRAWQTTWNLGETKIPSTAPPVFVRPTFVKFPNYTKYNSACAWDDKDPANYFAIRAVFDEKGNFRGFWSAGCDDSNDDGWVDFEVIFHLAENCQVLAGVLDGAGNAKAYTDRLYQATSYKLNFGAGAVYTYDQTFSPFGGAQSIEPPLSAPSPGAFAWIAGDNLKAQSLIGTPDLSYFGENYTLGGSPLACGDQCGQNGGTGQQFSKINRTTLEQGLGILRQLFTKVQSLFYWLPGAEEKICKPSSGSWPYSIPCQDNEDCETEGSDCLSLPECVGGIFEGQNCLWYEFSDYDNNTQNYKFASSDSFCQAQEPLCLKVNAGTKDSDVEAWQCANSVRRDASCSTGDLPPAGEYKRGGEVVVTVEEPGGSDKYENNAACNAQGVCINWKAHERPLETDNRCYGSINHGEKCTSDADCVSESYCDSATKLCKGVWEYLGIDRACETDTDCSLTGGVGCSLDVKRCVGGVMNGVRCDGNESLCSTALSCVDKYNEAYGLPERVRGYVDKVCTRGDGFQALNNPCETNNDCAEERTCQPVNLSSVLGAGFNFNEETENTDTGDQGSPPTISAIDFTKCDQVTGTCRAAKLNAFNLNNWYYGVLTGQDQLKTTLRFYAWADHDQMPIVSRTIDWGDGSPKDSTTVSKYKNQKPYCGTSVKECSGVEGLTCKTNADCPGGTGSCESEVAHFGNDPAACVQGHFQFEHTFICGGSGDLPECKDAETPFTVDPPTNDAIPADGCQTDTACFFRPRIQVLDNWGWCNGDCFGTPGCYADECFVEGEFPSWTNFDGYIKVNK